MRFRFAAVLIVLVLTFSVIPMRTADALDTSVRAMKARESDVYSPNTAWELGFTGDGINIAIIGYGVGDQRTPVLADKFVAGADFALDGTPKDGSYNPTPTDSPSHDTMVAACAMGNDPNDPEYQGSAKDSMLIDIKIAYNVVFSSTDFIEAMDWCIQNKDTDWDGNESQGNEGIQVIALSFGLGEYGDGTDIVSQKVEEALTNGLIVVTSAGNDGEVEGYSSGFLSPCGDDVIVVGASSDNNTVIRDDDTIGAYSNWGPRFDDGDDDLYDELKPDVVAPGTEIEYPLLSTDSSLIGSGTSWSCPQVTGLVALMLEANHNLTPSEVKDILHITAEPRGTPEYPDYPFPHNKWNRSYGYGMVDAYAAVQMALEYGGGGGDGNLSTPIMNAMPSPDDDGAYTVSWSAVFGADDYELMEANNPEFDNNFTFPSLDGTSYYITDMPNGTYYYKVRAKDSTRTSEFSNAVSVTVNITIEPGPGPGPEPPTELDAPEFLGTPASPERNGRFNLSWSSVIDVLGYTLQESTEHGFYDYNVQYDGDATTFEVTDKANGTYYYRVRGYNMTSVSGWSQSVTVKVELDTVGNEEPDGNETEDDGGFLGIPGFAGAEVIFVVVLVAMLASVRRRRGGSK
jgi:hypothetical protein